MDSRERSPHLKLASAVMFVHRLERSVAFYQELLALDIAVMESAAALLVSPDGYQLYLRTRGDDAVHPLGNIGVQYLIWTADGEDDLRRCEQVLQAHSAHVSTQTVEGFTIVEGRSPDNVPVFVTYPGPDKAPRTKILSRIYRW